MTWYVEFIPNESSSVTVLINNQPWITWQSSEGNVTKKLSFATEDPQIHIYAATYPRGKNASLLVLWNTDVRQVMDFDVDEDHDVSSSRKPRLFAADRYAQLRDIPKSKDA
jgi:hypothetical protein